MKKRKKDFLTSEYVHHNYVYESISSCIGYWYKFTHLLYLAQLFLYENCVDPDWTSHPVPSKLGLHCSHMFPKGFPVLKGPNEESSQCQNATEIR